MQVPLLSRLRRSVADNRSDAPGTAIDVLGRFGLVGYGVVHLLVAWLALQIAIGVPGMSADARGAVGALARTRFGAFALGSGAAGLLAFAIWQLSAAAVGFHWVRESERFRKRLGAVSEATAMVALSVVTVRSLLNGTTGSANTGAVSASADLLSLPAGRIILGAAAAAILALAAGILYTGVRCTFMGDLDVHRLSPGMRRVITLIGAIGHIARAAAMAVVGLLMGSAAFFADPRRAGGLDAALRALGQTDLGSTLLIAVALGFAAYGVFCLADAATCRA